MARTTKLEKDTLRNQYLESVRTIQKELRNYWLNASFDEGYQWTHWLPGANTINDVDVESERMQAVMNRIRVNKRVLMANLIQRPLSFSILPTSSDDAAMLAARAGEALLEDLRKNQDWEQLREESVQGIIKGGTGALAVEWDEDEGDVVVSPLAITEFLIEPGVRRYQQARWWMKVQALPPRLVADLYPENFSQDELPPSDAKSGVSVFQNKLVGLHKYEGQVAPDLTLVITKYERPHKGCPDGKFEVEIDNEIVDEGDWPFEFKNLNLVVGRETVLEDQWSGSTFLDDVRRVQAFLNVLWTEMAEHVRNVGTGKIIVPESAWDRAQVFTDEPGAMYPWPDGLERPEYMAAPSPGAWVERLLDKCAEYIDDLMGVHDVSRGVAPQNIESGFGVSIIAEKDSSPVGRILAETTRMWAQVGQMCLSMYEQRGTKRTITVNMGLGPERLDLDPKTDLKGQRDVIIPIDKIIPRSRAAMEARADKLLQMGIITDVAQYARVADLADADEIVDAINPDVSKARRENEMMAAGSNEHANTTREFDDHQIHAQVHDDFRKSRRYELLGNQAKTDTDNHVQYHMNQLQQQQGEDAKRQALLAAAQETMSGGAQGAPAQAAPPELPTELADPDAVAAGAADALDIQFPAGYTPPPGA